MHSRLSQMQKNRFFHLLLILCSCEMLPFSLLALMILSQIVQSKRPLKEDQLHPTTTSSHQLLLMTMTTMK